MQPLAVISASGLVSAAQILVGATIMGGVLFHELPSKMGIQPAEMSVRRCAVSCGKTLCRCIPEVMGVSTVLFIALILRLRGDTEAFTDPIDIQTWEQIKQEWPILMGADTLLNLQAMLRLVVILFVGVRANASSEDSASPARETAISPLSGSCAALFLASMMVRGLLSTRSMAYRYEGPLALGGDLPILCEAAMVPFLASLAVSAFRYSKLMVMTLVGGAVAFSQYHYLRLDGMPQNDSLFILAHVLETLAAFAFVARTIKAYCSPKRSSGIVGFMQILMPIQQALSAYYFLTAWENYPKPVGSGRPMCVLIIGNLLQLMAYLCAAGLYLGEYTLVNEDGSASAREEVVAAADEDALVMPVVTSVAAPLLNVNQ